MRKPTLAIIYATKNDDYVDRFVERTEFVLNYNTYLVTKYAKDVEITMHVLDWCSEVPMREVLKLSSEGERIVRFHEVQSNALPKNALSSGVHVGMALNIAVNSVASDYVLLSGSDQFFSPHSMLSINQLFCLSYETPVLDYYGLIPRRFITFEPIDFFRNFTEVSHYFETINSSSLPFRNQKIDIGTGVGGHLLKRSTFIGVGGFNEDWGGYGAMDAEFFGRVSIDVNHCDLSNFGVSLFKLPRTSNGTRLKRVYERVTPKHYFNVFNNRKKQTQGFGIFSEGVKICRKNNHGSTNSKGDTSFLCSPLNLKIPRLLKMFLCLRIVHPFYTPGSLVHRAPKRSDINFFFQLCLLIKNQRPPILLIDTEVAALYLPAILFLFPHTRVIILHADDGPLFDYEISINGLLRGLEKTGYYSRIETIFVSEAGGEDMLYRRIGPTNSPMLILTARFYKVFCERVVQGRQICSNRQLLVRCRAYDKYFISESGVKFLSQAYPVTAVGCIPGNLPLKVDHFFLYVIFLLSGLDPLVRKISFLYRWILLRVRRYFGA